MKKTGEEEPKKKKSGNSSDGENEASFLPEPLQNVLDNVRESMTEINKIRVTKVLYVGTLAKLAYQISTYHGVFTQIVLLSGMSSCLWFWKIAGQEKQDEEVELEEEGEKEE